MSERGTFGGPILWQPTSEYVERAHLTAFMHHYDIPSFQELHQRSIEDVAWFTAALLDYLGILFHKPYQHVLDTSDGIAWSHWCVGGEMNIVESCLDRWIVAGQGRTPALHWEGEDGRLRALTYDQLNAEVARTANALRSLGFDMGHTIAIYMPMIPEIVIALLAIAKIGATALPLFSGYGSTAITTRLRDAHATGLFTADGYIRRGNSVKMKSTTDAALSQLPDIKHVIVVRHSQMDIEMQPGRDHWFDDLLADQPEHADTTMLDPEAILMILYTSGTTGRPKGAVHTHCGFPVKAAQDMAFGTDVHTGDMIYWMTDMGWMMGPWLVFGTLILGGSFLLYDGAPDYPDYDRIWSLCAHHGVNVLGISPTLIRSLMPHGSSYAKLHDLTQLRCFGSTGEPWNSDPWHWLFEDIGESQKPIINYSGGTEISGGILMGNPISPLKACAFSGPCPGIDVEIYDEGGVSVRGQVGELVIKAPWIGMARGFWNDPQRYLQTYWSRWEDVWVHGDFAAVDEDGSWYILGRSDDTLKVAGKRVGPAEIESILVQASEVIEAAVIGIPDAIKGSAIIAFCVVNPSRVPDQLLSNQLIQDIIDGLGKPLAPKAIHFIPDLPKTRNAKVMRRMLRAAYLGVTLGDTSALVNPEILDHVASLRKGENIE